MNAEAVFLSGGRGSGECHIAPGVGGAAAGWSGWTDTDTDTDTDGRREWWCVEPAVRVQYGCHSVATVRYRGRAICRAVDQGWLCVCVCVAVSLVSHMQWMLG